MNTLSPQKESTSPSKPTPPEPKTPSKIKQKESQIQQKYLHRISTHPTLTPYRRRVYRTLLSVPPGRWTTYSAMAKYLNSSARAVGNAMRTNPFAPEVPCHRVLAADGFLGGYKGEWKVDGTFRDEKRVRLRDEGVVFEEGRARGDCFMEFQELGVKVKR
ncbi:Winged helix-turn-helix transcription repressor DNA-binding [Penicillium angulare]|uniref:Winged helix-turn-helix transcription repressor DNA-binding n=1 Tax=Penicillium angulare TaxID=116970 RepID=UPI002541A8D0|nr:Winged helix-turn-helix transcription repressor DNA-binding [Penicillium angulare]KAJ5288990.1 Winged helix-turn-helix transcription repressor DNA-binding [Penicillium angulare]